MIDYVIISQARTSSKRLPFKALRNLGGQPMVMYHIDLLWKSPLTNNYNIDAYMVTSEDPSDDIIEYLCEKRDVVCIRGSLEDVHSRFMKVLKDYSSPTKAIRITADCPMLEAHNIHNAIKTYENSECPVYMCFNNHIEIFDIDLFKSLPAITDYEKEHVTPRIKDDAICDEVIKLCDASDYYGEYQPVDTLEDLEKLRSMLFGGKI